MISRILQLNSDEVLRALETVNPIAVLVNELVGMPGDADGSLTPWPGDLYRGTETGPLVLLEDRGVGSQCILPGSMLHELRTATLTTLAARELVVPGVVTAAVLGPGSATRLPLALITRYLPGLSHVTVCHADKPNEAPEPMEPSVVDQLDLAGIGWSVATAVADAVFGATLVVTAVARPYRLEVAHLARGAMLVNTTGEDLEDDLVDAVDEVYVDDATLVDGNPHRHFVRMHLAGPRTGSTWFGRTTSGAMGRRHRRIAADLGQVLTGRHAGRTHVDDVLLVELLGTDTLDARLACTLHRAALKRGLGIRVAR